MKKQLLSIIIASTTLPMQSMDNKELMIAGGTIITCFVLPAIHKTYKYLNPTLEDLKEEEKKANEQAEEIFKTGTIDDRATYRKKCIEANRVL